MPGRLDDTADGFIGTDRIAGLRGSGITRGATGAIGIGAIGEW